MIDINMYRCRIGRFSQKLKIQKFSRFYGVESYSYEYKSSKRNRSLRTLLVIMKIFVPIAACLSMPLFSPNFYAPALNISGPLEEFAHYETWDNRSGEVGMTGNFFARYLNGNGVKKSPKGIRAFHLNIRSLLNKVCEVKRIVKETNPHILGLSECELKKNSPNLKIEKLKVPGYQIVFPKSWELYGYARVVV